MTALEWTDLLEAECASSGKRGRQIGNRLVEKTN